MNLRPVKASPDPAETWTVVPLEPARFRALDAHGRQQLRLDRLRQVAAIRAAHDARYGRTA